MATPQARDGAPGEGRHRRPETPGPRLLTLPAVLRTSRWSPSAAAVLGMLGVVVVVLAVFGARVFLASRQGDLQLRPGSGPSVSISRGPGVSPSAPVRSGGVVPTPADGSAGPAVPASGDGPERESSQRVTVDVVGQVRRPGVVVLVTGSRVRDAVAAAGGVLPGADLAAINSARLLADGEQVRIPKPGEVVVGGTGGSTAGGGPARPQGGGTVDLNAADLAALDSLPGVGPVLAQRILDWRANHGRFTSVDELGEVSGIGEKLLARLRPKVTV